MLMLLLCNLPWCYNVITISVFIISALSLAATDSGPATGEEIRQKTPSLSRKQSQGLSMRGIMICNDIKIRKNKVLLLKHKHLESAYQTNHRIMLIHSQKKQKQFPHQKT